MFTIHTPFPFIHLKIHPHLRWNILITNALKVAEILYFWYTKVRLFFTLSHRFDWKYSALYDSYLIIHIKNHPSRSLDWLLDYLPDYFLDYFLDYKNSRNRINARILISTGTIVFHERYDHFSRKVRSFFVKSMIVFLKRYVFYIDIFVLLLCHKRKRKWEIR